jgi:hypothetical protein
LSSGKKREQVKFLSGTRAGCLDSANPGFAEHKRKYGIKNGTDCHYPDA